MKVTYTNSFFKSLVKINRHNSWYYRTYQFCRRKIPAFFKNIYYFRKILLEFQWWDYRFNLTMFRTSLEITEKNIREKGIEVDESRLEKCDRMKRVIQLLKNVETDDYISMAEKELGKELILTDWKFEPIDDKGEFYEVVDNKTEEEKEHNNKIYDKSRELEETEWKELWDILNTDLKGWWD